MAIDVVVDNWQQRGGLDTMEKFEICLALGACACLIIAGIANGGLSMFQSILLMLDGIVLGWNLPR